MLKRRRFLKQAGVALAFPAIVRAKSERPLRTAVIGVGGRCVNHWNWLKSDTEVVALCDVDTAVLSKVDPQYKGAARGRTAGALWPEAKRFQDYRELFETPDGFDAAIVCTPDHHHVYPVCRALDLGKAVFCEKPLSWSVEEARTITDLVGKRRVATQMGNQGTGSMGWRLAHALYHGGAIGKVTRVHAWMNKAGNATRLGASRPEGADPFPDTLNWDHWIGPAAERPYKSGIYHPKKWRSWCDFSNGTLGDFGCHTLNAFFRVLEPGYPESVEVLDSTPFNGETWPKGQTLRWRFPEAPDRPTFDLTWYEGEHLKRVPLPEAMRGRKTSHGGLVIEGERGVIHVIGRS
ncbi:MAG: Gfo/Idh/MocA family oxidoreductase [Verrucomicrobiota bacterium]